MLEEVLAGAKTTFVFGNDEISEQIKRLVATPEPSG